MEPYIENATQVASHRSDFGAKTTRFLDFPATIRALPFWGVSAKTLAHIFPTGVTLEGCTALAASITETCGSGPLIIRSSGLSEDGTEHAHAGAFKSAPAMDPQHVFAALFGVLTDAQQKLGSLESFSILIQPYITPTISGVVFTRDPLVGMHGVISWSTGADTAVVSGKQSTTFLWSRSVHTTYPHTWMASLTADACALEHIFGSPQDVEWIFDGTQYAIVQSRPITTIPPATQTYFLALEKQYTAPFCFESDGTAETYPYPSPLTLSILSELEKKDGPITRVYTKMGVHTDAQPTYVIHGGKLYIDKELELRNFFPSHTVFKDWTISPHWAHVSGSIRAIRNMLAMSFVSMRKDVVDTAEKNIEQYITQGAPLLQALPSTTAAWNALSGAYEPIFTINTLAATSMRHVTALLKPTDPPLIEVLSLPIWKTPEHQQVPDGLIGNSLNIEDTTAFVSGTEKRTPPSEATMAWWSQLPVGKKVVLESRVGTLQRLTYLRERARVCTVLYASIFRAALKKEFAACGLEEHLMGEITLAEALGNLCRDRALLEKRASDRERSTLSLPRILSSHVPVTVTAYTVVSQGTAQGRYITRDALSTYSGAEKVIVYTDVLDPDIVPYFSKIAGIISREGSVLSHLAIMAREYGIPVVVDPARPEKPDGTCIIAFDTAKY
jgi:phosphohistidine swiveling domain-containing protein